MAYKCLDMEKRGILLCAVGCGRRDCVVWVFKLLRAGLVWSELALETDPPSLTQKPELSLYLAAPGPASRAGQS